MSEPESPLSPDYSSNGNSAHGNPASANGVDIRYHLGSYAQSEEWLPGGLSILALYRHSLLWEQILGLAAEMDIYPLDVEKAVDAWLVTHPRPNGKALRGKDIPMVITLSEVMPKPVEWLWNPYIPLGKLTILEGDPEVGRTWIGPIIMSSATTGSFACCKRRATSVVRSIRLKRR
jgi:hypothetical protein